MTSLNITCIAYFIERLKIMWRKLGFEVDFHENKTAEEMRHIAINTARINHREYDCLVFCILTHGGACGILYGTDGRPVHIVNWSVIRWSCGDDEVINGNIR